MSVQKIESYKPTEDQIIYANLLVIGVWTGLFVLTITYAIYVLEILKSHVDLATIPQVWHLAVNEYLAITHSPHGWKWLALLTTGDFANYIGFVLFGLMTLFCFIVLLRGYLRQKNRIYASIAFLEILVLSLAASGLLGSGGH